MQGERRWQVSAERLTQLHAPLLLAFLLVQSLPPQKPRASLCWVQRGLLQAA